MTSVMYLNGVGIIMTSTKKIKRFIPKGAEKGVYRIARGGSFNSDLDACSSTARVVLLPILRKQFGLSHSP